MVFVNGKKYACESCINGHRSSSCSHSLRPLFELKGKGRPPTQCETCRHLRKTRRAHLKCLCNGEDEQPKQRTRKRLVPGTLPSLPRGLQDIHRANEESVPGAHRRRRVKDLLNPCMCAPVGACTCGNGHPARGPPPNLSTPYLSSSPGFSASSATLIQSPEWDIQQTFHSFVTSTPLTSPIMTGSSPRSHHTASSLVDTPSPQPHSLSSMGMIPFASKAYYLPPVVTIPATSGPVLQPLYHSTAPPNMSKSHFQSTLATAPSPAPSLLKPVLSREHSLLASTGPAKRRPALALPSFASLNLSLSSSLSSLSPTSLSPLPSFSPLFSSSYVPFQPSAHPPTSVADRCTCGPSCACPSCDLHHPSSSTLHSYAKGAECKGCPDCGTCVDNESEDTLPRMGSQGCC